MNFEFAPLLHELRRLHEGVACSGTEYLLYNLVVDVCRANIVTLPVTQCNRPCHVTGIFRSDGAGVVGTGAESQAAVSGAGRRRCAARCVQRGL